MSKLKMSVAVLSAVGLALIGSMLSPTPFIKPAMAGPGIRLCSYIAKTQTHDIATNTVVPGAMAFVRRVLSTATTTECNNVRVEMANQRTAYIQWYPAIANITFEAVQMLPCETPGAYFVSTSYPSADMCNYAGGSLTIARKVTATGITRYGPP